MEWLWENLTTTIPWIGATIAWGWPAWTSSTTYRRERDAREWTRYEQLVRNLYNGKGDGYWVQLAAIEEMGSMSGKRALTLKIFNEARQHWAKPDQKKDGRAHQIVAELDRAISSLGG